MNPLMKKLFGSRFLGRNLLAPGRGIVGALASRGMTKGNRLTSEDAARRLGAGAEHFVVELGPGSGWGLKVLASGRPKKLVGVEISARFREELAALDLPVDLEVRAEDAIDMSAYAEAGSVDRLLAVNVVYFLKPLKDYAAEFYRIMAPGGRALLACKTHLIQNAHDEIFVNKDLVAIITAFEATGFQVTSEEVDLGNRAASYSALYLQK